MLDRRRFLRTAGIVAGAAAVPAVSIGVAQGLARSRGAAQDDVTPGSVTASKRFDLTAASTELLREVALGSTRVLQSFAFDNTNGHLFTVQLVDGGLQLPGETQIYSGADREANGDLCLTRLDTSGNILGTMYLRGFGHGVQIGVEATGSGAYVWTETHNVRSLNSDGTTYTGWGDRLARFEFANGTVLTADSPALTQYTLENGVDRTTCAIDPVNNRLAVRCRVSGAFRFRLYDLAAFKSGSRTTLADIAQPADLQPGYTDTFQGFASYGSYLYLLAGSPYGTNGSVSPNGNTYITSLDWNTGTVTEQKLSKAGYTLSYREPEGMAIQIPDPNNPQALRLCSGFSSFTSDTDQSKKASVYYKAVLV